MEYSDILKFAAVFQNVFVGEQFVDTVQPLPRIAAAYRSLTKEVLELERKNERFRDDAAR